MSYPVEHYSVGGRTGAIVWRADWRTLIHVANDAPPRDDSVGWVLHYEVGGSAQEIALATAPPWDGVSDETWWWETLAPHAAAALPPEL